MVEKKELKTSQKELLKMKREKITEATILFERRKMEFSQTLDIIAKELGVQEGEFKQWGLSKDDSCLERIKTMPTETTVKERKKGRK